MHTAQDREESELEWNRKRESSFLTGDPRNSPSLTYLKFCPVCGPQIEELAKTNWTLQAGTRDRQLLLDLVSMGTELSKQEEGERLGSAVEASAATTRVIMAKWHAWLQDTEDLYLQGRFRAYREVRAFCYGFPSCCGV